MYVSTNTLLLVTLRPNLLCYIGDSERPHDRSVKYMPQGGMQEEPASYIETHLRPL